jgi:cold shock CspA family protein
VKFDRRLLPGGRAWLVLHAGNWRGRKLWGAVMRAGVIKRMGAKGFGFIVPDDERGDVFFNIGDCHLRNTFLQVGDRVEYEINQFADGKRRKACEVRKIINAAR